MALPPYAEFCPRCGVSQDVGLVTLEPSGSFPASIEPAAPVERSPRQERRASLWKWIGGVLALVVLVLALRATGEPTDRATTPTTRREGPTTGLTPAPRVIVEDRAVTTTRPDGADAVGTAAVPPGPTGYVYALTTGGPAAGTSGDGDGDGDGAESGTEEVQLLEIDLGSGASRSWALPGWGGGPLVEARLGALEDGLLIQLSGIASRGAAGGAGSLVLALPWRRCCPPVALEFGTSRLVADDGRRALLLSGSSPGGSSPGRYRIVDGEGRDGAGAASGELGANLRALAPHGDDLVVAAPDGTLGLVPARPENGRTTSREEAVPLGRGAGRLLAADGRGGIWLDCAALLRCELRLGTWSAPERISVAVPLAGVDDIEAFLAGGGSFAVVTLRSPANTTQHVIDRRTGLEALPAGSGDTWRRDATASTPDGRWLVWAGTDRGTSRQLRFAPTAPTGSGAARLSITPLGVDVAALTISPRRLG